MIRLVDENGKVYAEASTKPVGAEWKKLELVLTAKENAEKASLQVIPQFTGKVALDMVSLFLV